MKMEKDKKECEYYLEINGREFCTFFQGGSLQNRYSSCTGYNKTCAEAERKKENAVILP